MFRRLLIASEINMTYAIISFGASEYKLAMSALLSAHPLYILSAVAGAGSLRIGFHL